MYQLRLNGEPVEAKRAAHPKGVSYRDNLARP